MRSAMGLEPAATDQFAELLQMEMNPDMRVSSPTHLAQMNHFVFRSSRDFCAPLRVLIAGGGTGFKTFALASQLVDMHARAFEIVHVDISARAIEFANHRLATRKRTADLTVQRSELGRPFVRFIHGSIFDLPTMDLGLFDYVDLSGVLMLLDRPVDALRILRSHVAEGGGLGCMVYAETGRVPVWYVRDVLRTLERHHDDSPFAYTRRIARARSLLEALPPSHPIKRDAWQWQVLVNYLEISGDTGLVDLFLTSQDATFRVSTLLRMFSEAGWSVVDGSFLPPIVYDVHALLSSNSSGLAYSEIAALPRAEQLSTAELLYANTFHHTFYAVASPISASAVCDGTSASCSKPTAVDQAAALISNASLFSWSSQDDVLLQYYPIPVGFNPVAAAAGLLCRTCTDQPDRPANGVSAIHVGDAWYNFDDGHDRSSDAEHSTRSATRPPNFLNHNATLILPRLSTIGLAMLSLVDGFQSVDSILTVVCETLEAVCTATSAAQKSRNRDTKGLRKYLTAAECPAFGYLTKSGKVKCARSAILIHHFREVFHACHGMERMYLSSTPLEPTSLRHVNNFYSQSASLDRPAAMSGDANQYNYFTFRRCLNRDTVSTASGT